MKKTVLFFLIVFTIHSCESQDRVFIKHNDLSFSINELEGLLQDALNLKQLDYLFNDTYKNKGVTVVINDFIKPYYKKLKLKKFGKSVHFKTHGQIFLEREERFFDILSGSFFMEGDTLNIIIGLRSNYTAIHGKWKMKNGKWKMENKIEPHSNYSPMYNFKKDKEQCLAEQIKALKSQKPIIEKCKKYKFD